MRILLDESLPRKLTLELPGHDARTVQRRGWTGLKNGALEPRIGLAQSYGMNPRHVHAAMRLIREHEDEIRAAWKTHFPS